MARLPIRSFIGVAVLVLLLSAVTSSAALTAKDSKGRSAEECEQLGFQREVVRCRFCETLLQHTGNADLQEECLTCCTADENDNEPAVVYTSARFELRGMAGFLQNGGKTEMGKFRHEYAAQPYFSHISFENRYDAFWPRLVLVGDNGEELVMQISGWTAFHIHEFLRKKLTV